MPKCPYCQNEINIEDFFNIPTKQLTKGEKKARLGDFKGQYLQVGYRSYAKMWSCPSCDSILGFSEYAHDSYHIY